MARVLRAMFAVAGYVLSCTLASAADAPQWGGSSARNNVSKELLAADWDPGAFERKTGIWNKEKARNIRWVARLGSQSYGSPVIADGRVFVGTNNSHGYLPRYPDDVDLGCLLCFDERDGKFLWQFSAEKLPTGRVHDWPMQGIVSAPLVEQDRAWFVSNRGEVVCIDTRGFYDDEDDGPIVNEEGTVFETRSYAEEDAASLAKWTKSLDERELPVDLRERFIKAGEALPAKIEVAVDTPGKAWSFVAPVTKRPTTFRLRVQGPHLRASRSFGVADKQEADVVWRFDMMKELGSQQHNLATCCITAWKDTLFVCTGNGVDESHINIPAPEAPSFFAMDKTSGKVLWTSNLPGKNIHHAQWSAPAVGLLGGVPQVILNGGDGWVYSFHAEDYAAGKPRLLWKFDTNDKDAKLLLGGRGTRNEPIAPPVLYDGKVFVTTGQDPEHGEGAGRIWCIDPTKKLDGSDVSSHKVLDAKGQVVPPRREKHIREWSERRIWSVMPDQLDKGIVNADFRKQFLYVGAGGALLGDVKVRVVTPGAEWELSTTGQERPETVMIWKRSQVNDVGEPGVSYFAARRSGERIVENPDSAAIWKYDQVDRNGDGKFEFEEEMHRTISSVVIQDGLLFCPDFSGLLHCLDAETGKPHWTYDLLAACWGTPLIADGRVFVGDEDGDLAIFNLSADPDVAGKPKAEGGGAATLSVSPQQPVTEINMQNSLYTNPVAANGVLFIANKSYLFAIEADDEK